MSVFHDLAYKNPSDYYTITGKMKSGRKFRYKIGKFLRELKLGHTKKEVEALARDALDEKYKFCQWDLNHPDVPSDREIYGVLVKEFSHYLQWLNDQEEKKKNLSNNKE